MKNQIIVLLSSFLFLLNINLTGQNIYQDIDYLEIRFEYSHSLLKDGYKFLRIVRSQDSCYFDTRNTRPKSDSAWFMLKPNKMESISCSDFDEVVNNFNRIERSEILDHNKDMVIMDGYRFTLTLTNMNSEISYSLYTAQRSDKEIENF